MGFEFAALYAEHNRSSYIPRIPQFRMATSQSINDRFVLDIQSFRSSKNLSSALVIFSMGFLSYSSCLGCSPAANAGW